MIFLRDGVLYRLLNARRHRRTVGDNVHSLVGGEDRFRLLNRNRLNSALENGKRAVLLCDVDDLVAHYLILKCHSDIHRLRVGGVSGGGYFNVLNLGVIDLVSIEEPEIKIRTCRASVLCFTEILDDGNLTRVYGVEAEGNRDEEKDKYECDNYSDERCL